MSDAGSRSLGRPDPIEGVDPAKTDRSLGELVSEMTSEFSTLVRQEIELAKVETKEEVGKAGKAAGMMAAAGVAALLFLIFASHALAWLLDKAMPTPLAYLIVAVIWAVVAGGLFVAGRARMRTINPVPQRTVETIKEDVQWAKAQRS